MGLVGAGAPPKPLGTWLRVPDIHLRPGLGGPVSRAAVLVPWAILAGAHSWPLHRQLTPALKYRICV